MARQLIALLVNPLLVISARMPSSIVGADKTCVLLSSTHYAQQACTYRPHGAHRDRSDEVGDVIAFLQLFLADEVVKIHQAQGHQV